MNRNMKWPAWVMLSLGLVVGAAIGHYWRAPGVVDKIKPSIVPSSNNSPSGVVDPVRAEAKPVASANRPASPVAVEKKSVVSLKDFQVALEDLARGVNTRYKQGDWVKLIDQLDEGDLHSAVGIVMRSREPWVRITGLQGLFKRCAENDPESALREAMAITSLNDRNSALTGVFQAWSKKDAVAVVRWLQSQPKGQALDKILQAAISGLAENAPEATYLLLQSMAPHLLRNFSWQIFMNWAKTDPATALSKMMTMPSSRQWGGGVQGVVAEWAKRDYSAAEAWVNAQPKGASQTEAVRGLLGTLALTDPSRAVAMVLAMPDAQERKNSLQMILWPWSQNDLAGAVAWVKQLQDESLKQVAMPQIMGAWAAVNPTEAADYAMSLPMGRQRTAALGNLVGTWANSDAKAALEWVKSLPPGRDQQAALQSSIYSLAQSEPAATAALIDAMPMSSTRRNCIGSLLQSWVEVDSAKALEWAQALPSLADRVQAYQQLAYSSWARQSPTQAVAVLMSLPAGQQRNNSLSSLVSQWAYQDFQGALDWSLKLEDATLRKQTLRNIQGRWIELNPVEAVTFVRDQKDWARDGSLSSAVHQWSSSDPVSAITWVAQLPGKELEQLLPAAIGAWAESNPVEAAKYVSKLQPGNMQNEAAAQTVSRWAQQDPVRAAKWAAGFANEDLRIRACRDVVSTWVQNDPDSAGAWVKELPSGKPREAALQSLVNSLQYGDPKAAAQWVENVADPNQRNQMMENVARHWLETDSSAKTWILNSSLPEETKTRLLKTAQNQN